MKMSDLNALPWMERWRMLPPPGGTILCAVSGGRDSVCLLHYLHHLGQTHGFTVAAAHLNHLMRPTAQRDEDFVRALCASLDVPFHTEKADVYALCDTWGLTVEETGRRARYDFLRRTASAIHADFIATAHHREDQAETVLLQHLIMGGGEVLLSHGPTGGQQAQHTGTQHRRRGQHRLAGDGRAVRRQQGGGFAVQIVVLRAEDVRRMADVGRQGRVDGLQLRPEGKAQPVAGVGQVQVRLVGDVGQAVGLDLSLIHI